MITLDPAHRRFIAEQTRTWRDGYEAGLRDRQTRHRFLTIGIVLGALVIFRRPLRRLHSLLWLAWLVLWLVALSPVIVLGLAVETTWRSWRSWRSWRRTVAVGATWLAAFGLVAGAILTASAWWLVPIPVAVVAWGWAARRRLRAELRYDERSAWEPFGPEDIDPELLRRTPGWYRQAVEESAGGET